MRGAQEISSTCINARRWPDCWRFGGTGLAGATSQQVICYVGEVSSALFAPNKAEARKARPKWDGVEPGRETSRHLSSAVSIRLDHRVYRPGLLAHVV